MKEKWLPVSIVGNRLNISRSSVYRLVSEGNFKAAKFGDCMRVSEKSLEEYIAKQVVKLSCEYGFNPGK